MFDRTILGVPMLRDGHVIGAIAVWRREVKPFSDKQIAPDRVLTFALIRATIPAWTAAASC
jgi:hypothetical protein